MITIPIYDFKCGKCNNVFESIEKNNREVIRCRFCNGFAWRIFTGTRFVPFKSYWEKNLGDEPIFIKSKKQLRKECNKRGLDYTGGCREI